MGLFLGLGIGGIALLILSLVFDGVLESVFDGALDGLFDGWLSLPVVAGFVSMLGFTGAIVLGSTGLGTGAAAATGAVAGAGAGGWRTGSAVPSSAAAARPPPPRTTSWASPAGW
ncbi:hypothetical protein SABIM44S_00278 [Streptomyces abikoensis]